MPRSGGIESCAERFSGGGRKKENWRAGFGRSYIADPGFRLTQCEESGVGLNDTLPKVTILIFA